MSKRELLNDIPDTTKRVVWTVFLTVASHAFALVVLSIAAGARQKLRG